MQHMKITKNLGEFQSFIDSDNKTGLCLEDTLGFFDIQRIYITEKICKLSLKSAFIRTPLRKVKKTYEEEDLDA